MMMKDFFNRLFFTGRVARQALNSLAKRLGAVERKLAVIASRSASSGDVPEPVAEAIHKAKADLSSSISEVIAALEGERVIIRGLESQMLDLQLSHPEGSHRELCREIDELRSRIERLEGGASRGGGDDAAGKEGDERN